MPWKIRNWLHHAIKFHPLYALALFVHVTVQLLARHAQAAIFWRFIIALTLAFFCTDAFDDRSLGG
jgi:hypothetical protein